MSREVAAIIGSGTTPFTYGILPQSQRGSQSGAEGVRTGVQVMIGNPEDINSVDAFAVSGVSIGTVPVKIWGPGINPLPRQRMIILHNDGPSPAYIGPTSTSVIAPSGMMIHVVGAAQGLPGTELPFMHNIEIWARADAGGASIRILVF